MSDETAHEFFDEDALLYRLTTGVREGDREVLFVVGSPLTSSKDAEMRGVASVAMITEMIRDAFKGSPNQLAILDSQLAESTNPYQAAFKFLQGRKGADGANRLIRQAVWQARTGEQSTETIDTLRHGASPV